MQFGQVESFSLHGWNFQFCSLRLEQFGQSFVEFDFRARARFELVDALNARRETKFVDVDAERWLPLLREGSIVGELERERSRLPSVE
mgnify:CR=1 FL=1